MLNDIFLDSVDVRNDQGEKTTWTLYKVGDEYWIKGEAINMFTKRDCIGTDKEQAKGIFERLFKRSEAKVE